MEQQEHDNGHEQQNYNRLPDTPEKVPSQLFVTVMGVICVPGDQALAELRP